MMVDLARRVELQRLSHVETPSRIPVDHCLSMCIRRIYNEIASCVIVLRTHILSGIAEEVQRGRTRTLLNGVANLLCCCHIYYVTRAHRHSQIATGVADGVLMNLSAVSR